MTGDSRRRLAGVAFAVVSAASFGVTIVVQRTLASARLPVTTALGSRFGIASVLLVALLAVTRGPLLPVPGERLRAALLGVVGYATEAGLFYLALGRGSAGAVALLFYAYPALVVVIEVLMGDERLRPATLLPVALCTGGAVLVVLTGGRVVISGAGVAFALASAGCFSVYMVTSQRLVVASDPRATAAWVAGGASLALLTVGAVTAGVAGAGSVWPPAEYLPRLLLNGAATAVAFACLYAALRHLGAGPTAVVMTLEAFVAVLLGAIVLEESVAALQLVGGAAIVAGAVLVSRTGREATPPPP